jgi:hypothetical protein
MASEDLLRPLPIPIFTGHTDGKGGISRLSQSSVVRSQWMVYVYRPQDNTILHIMRALNVNLFADY